MSPTILTLFPYTTLFRSRELVRQSQHLLRDAVERGDVIAQQGIRTGRSEEHTSELQSRGQLVCRLLPARRNCRHLLHRMALKRRVSCPILSSTHILTTCV